MVKSFKDKKGFIKNVGISRPTIYFKIGLNQCEKKFPSYKELKFVIVLA